MLVYGLESACITSVVIFAVPILASDDRVTEWWVGRYSISFHHAFNSWHLLVLTPTHSSHTSMPRKTYRCHHLRTSYGRYFCCYFGWLLLKIRRGFNSFFLLNSSTSSFLCLSWFLYFRNFLNFFLRSVLYCEVKRVRPCFGGNTIQCCICTMEYFTLKC